MDLPKATAEAGVRRSCRLLDGREAVTFLVRVKQYIEDPRFMLWVMCQLAERADPGELTFLLHITTSLA